MTSNFSRRRPPRISALCSVVRLNSYCSSTQRVQPSSMLPPVHGWYMATRGAWKARGSAVGVRRSGVSFCVLACVGGGFFCVVLFSLCGFVFFLCVCGFGFFCFVFGGWGGGGV